MGTTNADYSGTYNFEFTASANDLQSVGATLTATLDLEANEGIECFTLSIPLMSGTCPPGADPDDITLTSVCIIDRTRK